MRFGRDAKVAGALLLVRGVPSTFTVPAAAEPAPPNTVAAVLADKPTFLQASSHDRLASPNCRTSQAKSVLRGLDGSCPRRVNVLRLMAHTPHRST